MGGRALFIGGPGTISQGAIGELVGAGWDVRVLTHPKDPIPDLGARFLWGDRDDEADASRRLRRGATGRRHRHLLPTPRTR